MRLKKGFILHDTGKEYMLVPTGNNSFSGIVKGNRTFGEIVSLLQSDISKQSLVNEMTARYPESEKSVKRDVEKVLKALQEISALDE